MEHDGAQSLSAILTALHLALPVLCFVIGAVLCILGRRIVRPLCALSGLLSGGGLGFVAAQQFGDGHALLLWVIGGAAVGCVIVWLLFRLWMGISSAAMLAVVLPATVLVLSHHNPPIAARAAIAEMTLASPPQGAAPAYSQDTLAGQGGSFLTQRLSRMQQLGDYQSDLLQAWWADLASQDKQLLGAAALCGAALGLLGGLVFPYWAATLESSALGAFLILVALRSLLSVQCPALHERWMPPGPTHQLAALGLITLTGVLVQWTLLRSRADK